MTNALYDDSIRPEPYNDLADERFGDHAPNSPNPMALTDEAER